MGNPKAKLTPARAVGSERNAKPATAKMRTTNFFIRMRNQTKPVYHEFNKSRRQE
jgi:hypothetical protein